MRKRYATDRVGTDNQDILQDILEFIPGQNGGDIAAGWGAPGQVAIEINADFGGPDATAAGGKKGSGGGSTGGGTRWRHHRRGHHGWRHDDRWHGNNHLEFPIGDDACGQR